MSLLNFHQLTVRSVQPEADDALVLAFDVPAEWQSLYHFQPGQYLTLRGTVAGQEQRRSYSICAGPADGLRVGVRRVKGGVFTGWLHSQVKAGDGLQVMPPQGRFGAVLAQRPQRVLAVAAGSGITPILSIVKALLAGDPWARCTLVYGNRTAASTMLKEELEDLKNRYLTRFSLHTVFSQEDVDAPLNRGRINAEKLATVLRLTGAVDAVFVCGPHAMNDEVQAALQALGVAPGCLHIERLGAPPSLDFSSTQASPSQSQSHARDAPQARLRIVRDGMAREVPFASGDENILAAAMRAGLDMPYSCRSGVCATCRARVLEGAVRMERNFALEPAELEAGFVLTCQAHPLSERVVLSFDDR